MLKKDVNSLITSLEKTADDLLSAVEAEHKNEELLTIKRDSLQKKIDESAEKQARGKRIANKFKELVS